jgi:hypothetical protein
MTPTNRSIRLVSRDAVRTSVPAEVWEDNGAFVARMKQLIAEHPLLQHPLLGMLEQTELSRDALLHIHLEFRFTFAKIFTDSLILAMYQAQTLEPKYGPMAKVSARFLMQFNLLDELGFTPGSPQAPGQYGGAPRNAHFIQFDETLAQLGCPWQEADRHVPSDAAVRVRRHIESTYGDYALLLGTLAVAETVFDKFAAPWARNVAGKTDVDTEAGYHSIHVEHEGHSMDDVHSDDLWHVFQQGMSRERYEDVRTTTSHYLDLLVGFVDGLAGG